LTKHDIFKLAYLKLLNDSQFNISKIRNNNDIDLFIDATFVNNKTGAEMVNVNPLYYKKHVTKLSILCITQTFSLIKNKVPLSIIPVKTTSHDSKTIIQSIKDLNIKRRINLIADKGYIMNKKDKNILLKKHKVKLIVPKKKNQKNVRITKYMKSKLKIRNVVENCIQSLKSFNRVYLRRDRLIANYLSFVFIGSGLILNNKIN